MPPPSQVVNLLVPPVPDFVMNYEGCNDRIGGRRVGEEGE